MDALVLWRSLCNLIEPHYPKPGHGRRPVGLEAVGRAPLCLRAFVASRGGQGYPPLYLSFCSR